MNMTDEVYILVTMDCETAHKDVTPHSISMSNSGPWDYEESERSIRGYVTTAEAYGFPLTLFAHPEVAVGNRDLLLELEAQGACLGMHLHPYKFDDGRYTEDVGAYTARELREILEEAIAVWEGALGRKPLYFRSGYSSGNDSTYQVLYELGFHGAAISNPGRVLPEHCSVWTGAEPYPHRAHFGFRQLKGDTDFVEVPVSVDYERPIEKDHAGAQGYEWLYVPANYAHEEIVKHLLQRFKADNAAIPLIYLDSHNDQDYTDPDHPSSQNLELIFNAIVASCEAENLRPVGITMETVCDLVLGNQVQGQPRGSASLAQSDGSARL